jgi:hypothetical protein
MGAVIPNCLGDAFHGRRVDRTPGGVGMKTMPLVEEHALGSFEQDAAG